MSPVVISVTTQPSKAKSFGAVKVGARLSETIISKLSVAEQLESESFTVMLYVPAGKPDKSCVVELFPSSQE